MQALSADFLMASVVKTAQSAVKTIQMPLAVNGTNLNTEIGNAYAKSAEQSSTADMVTKAFNAHAASASFDYKNDTGQSRNSGVHQSGPSNEPSNGR